MNYDTYLDKEYDKYCKDTEVDEMPCMSFDEMVDFVLDNNILTSDELEIALGFGAEDTETIESAIEYKYGKTLDDMYIDIILERI